MRWRDGHTLVDEGVMRVRLVRKLADLLDGVDVSGHRSGDILELSHHDAELLIAERWAEPEAAAAGRDRIRDDVGRHGAASSASTAPAGRTEDVRDVNREHFCTGRDEGDR